MRNFFVAIFDKEAVDLMQLQEESLQLQSVMTTRLKLFPGK